MFSTMKVRDHAMMISLAITLIPVQSTVNCGGMIHEPTGIVFDAVVRSAHGHAVSFHEVRKAKIAAERGERGRRVHLPERLQQLQPFDLRGFAQVDRVLPKKPSISPRWWKRC